MNFLVLVHQKVVSSTSSNFLHVFKSVLKLLPLHPSSLVDFIYMRLKHKNLGKNTSKQVRQFLKCQKGVTAVPHRHFVKICKKINSCVDLCTMDWPLERARFTALSPCALVLADQQERSSLLIISASITREPYTIPISTLCNVSSYSNKRVKSKVLLLAKIIYPPVKYIIYKILFLLLV